MMRASFFILSIEQCYGLWKEGRQWTQRIKAARERRGLTQEELAALVNISPTHVSVIERGAKTVRMDTFVAIANVLEVSADSLLIDVVDHAAASAASELSDAIERLPYEERMRILKAIRILTEK